MIKVVPSYGDYRFLFALRTYVDGEIKVDNARALGFRHHNLLQGCKVPGVHQISNFMIGPIIPPYCSTMGLLAYPGDPNAPLKLQIWISDTE